MSKSTLKTLGRVCLVVVAITIIILMLMYTIKGVLSAPQPSCTREEVFVDYKPLTDYSGSVTGYVYTTNDGNIIEHYKSEPLNEPVCIERGRS